MTEPVVWYDDYFTRAKTKACKEMASCGPDFYPWLAEQRPDLYNRILEAENEIDHLWLARSEKDAFREACKTWYRILLDAKQAYDCWKAQKRQEELLSGRQESMALR